MSTKDSLLTLQSALLSTGLVQPVDTKSTGGYVEILSRQVPGQERTWLKAVDRMLELFASCAPEHGDLHVCRRYLRKKGSSQMVFGWHISLTCKNAKALSGAVGTAVAALNGFKASLDGPPVEDEPGPVQASPRPYQRPLAPGQHPSQRRAAVRAPNAPGTVQGSQPQNFSPTLKVVQNTVDENGKTHIVEEMPLPHVFTEMNKLNSKGRGAKFTGGG